MLQQNHLFLQLKSYGGYSSCIKCDIKGKYNSNRVCFARKVGKLQIDEEFMSQVDEDFHVGSSILVDILNFSPVSNVPLDYMHVVRLGVIKKFLKLWIPLPHRSYKKPFSISTVKVQELLMK